jgi:putative transposase
MQWEDTAGWKLTDSHRLRLLGIGEIKMNYYRPITGTPKAITVKREGKKWWVSVRCVDVPAQPLPATGREVGVDLGVVNLVAMSEGEPQQGERFGGRAKQQLSEARRRLSRKQRVTTGGAARWRSLLTEPATQRGPSAQPSPGQRVRLHRAGRPVYKENDSSAEANGCSIEARVVSPQRGRPKSRSQSFN